MPIATSAMRATIAPACFSGSRIRAVGHQRSPDTALPNLDRTHSHFCCGKIDMNSGLPNESHQDTSPPTRLMLGQTHKTLRAVALQQLLRNL